MRCFAYRCCRYYHQSHWRTVFFVTLPRVSISPCLYVCGRVCLCMSVYARASVAPTTITAATIATTSSIVVVVRYYENRNKVLCSLVSDPCRRCCKPRRVLNHLSAKNTPTTTTYNVIISSSTEIQLTATSANTTTATTTTTTATIATNLVAALGFGEF